MSADATGTSYILNASGYHFNIDLSNGVGEIEYDLFDDSDDEGAEFDQVAASLLSSFLLALACEGVNIGEGAFERALATSIDNYVMTQDMFPPAICKK